MQSTGLQLRSTVKKEGTLELSLTSVTIPEPKPDAPQSTRVPATKQLHDLGQHFLSPLARCSTSCRRPRASVMSSLAALGGGRKCQPEVKPSDLADLAEPAVNEALLESILRSVADAVRHGRGRRLRVRVRQDDVLPPSRRTRIRRPPPPVRRGPPSRGRCTIPC